MSVHLLFAQSDMLQILAVGWNRVQSARDLPRTNSPEGFGGSWVLLQDTCRYAAQCSWVIDGYKLFILSDNSKGQISV